MVRIDVGADHEASGVAEHFADHMRSVGARFMREIYSDTKTDQFQVYMVEGGNTVTLHLCFSHDGSKLVFFDVYCQDKELKAKVFG